MGGTVRRVVVVVVAGVAASMALGEFIPFLPVLGVRFGWPLTAVGWVSSGITLVAALACLPLGVVIGGRRLERVFVVGLLVLGVSGVVAGCAGGAGVLVAARGGQAVGYALVVIAGPVLLARMPLEGGRRVGLALWGLCVPAGLALVGGVAAVVGASGWRMVVVGVGVLALVLGVAAHVMFAYTMPAHVMPAQVTSAHVMPGRATSVAGWASRGGGFASIWPRRRGRRAGAGAGAGSWWRVVGVAAGFGLIALVGVSVVTVLASYLAFRYGLPAASASLLTGLVAAASVPGSVVAGAMLRAGVRPARLLVTAVLMAPLAPAVFGQGPLSLAVVGAAAILAVNGLAVSAIFAGLPDLSTGDPDRAGGSRDLAGGTPGVDVAGPGLGDGTTAGTARTVAAVTQAGSVGTLIGPPVYLWTAGTAGWPATIGLTAAIVCAGVACAIAALTPTRH
ncbi:MFS transporter [Nonomuraea sp. NPDC050547]|uniref:MFS transporter n=1 Tax=Nonomuraea sp. NPDC050547 TaxID=3364368 RepID=UPI003797F158